MRLDPGGKGGGGWRSLGPDPQPPTGRPTRFAQIGRFWGEVGWGASHRPRSLRVAADVGLY